MQLTYEQVIEMNAVQLEIFRAFVEVCEKLNLTYYMVHGSLLGSVIHKGFFPFDDDIDVAMFRKDYDILMSKGQEYLPKGLFLQSCSTQSEFPLPFGKIRKSETAFVQPMFKNLNINMGIYIDIFPIDYYLDNSIKKLLLRCKEAIYSARISTRLFYDNKQPIWKRLIARISIFLVPSWEKAVRKRASLYAVMPRSRYVIVVGGKIDERGIPIKWFGKGSCQSFEGISITCPLMLKKYLQQIYGDYKNYNPVQAYLNDDNTLTVSASKFSVEKSYRELL